LKIYNKISGDGGTTVNGFSFIGEDGFYIASGNSVISGNIFINYSDFAIWINAGGQHLISNNIFMSNIEYVYDDRDIFIVGSNNIISNNTFIDFYGVRYSAINVLGTNTVIENNSISGYKNAIYVNGNNIIIDNNYIINSRHGIMLSASLFSFNNDIRNNKFRNISGNCISISKGIRNNIYNNDIRNCNNGISVAFLSNFNTFTNNNLINIKNRKGYFGMVIIGVDQESFLKL